MKFGRIVLYDDISKCASIDRLAANSSHCGDSCANSFGKTVQLISANCIVSDFSTGAESKDSAST